MLKGLSHIAVLVTDVERSVEFYTRIPGISEHFRLHQDDGSVWLVYLRVADRQFIELFPRASGRYEYPKVAGYGHFCLEVDDIRAMYRDLVANGITPRSEPVLGADGSLQMWVDDPDGNPFEFHQFTAESRQIVL